MTVQSRRSFSKEAVPGSKCKVNTHLEDGTGSLGPAQQHDQAVWSGGQLAACLAITSMQTENQIDDEHLTYILQSMQVLHSKR